MQVRERFRLRFRCRCGCGLRLGQGDFLGADADYGYTTQARKHVALYVAPDFATFKTAQAVDTALHIGERIVAAFIKKFVDLRGFRGIADVDGS